MEDKGREIKENADPNAARERVEQARRQASPDTTVDVRDPADTRPI
jgi:hypothetical protein